MSNQTLRIIFQTVLTLTLFSFWAAFALLFINRFFYEDLVGYTIGRICIWEVIALGVAGLVAFLMIQRWGTLRIEERKNQFVLVLPIPFGIYFLVYFLLAVITGVWQFYLFSQQF